MMLNHYKFMRVPSQTKSKIMGGQKRSIQIATKRDA